MPVARSVSRQARDVLDATPIRRKAAELQVHFLIAFFFFTVASTDPFARRAEISSPAFTSTRILQQLPGGIKHQRIPAIQNRQRRKRLQLPGQLIQRSRRCSNTVRAAAAAPPPGHPVPSECPPACGAHRNAGPPLPRFQPPPLPFQHLPLRPLQPVLQIIQLLLAPVDHIHHARKCAVLRQFRQRLPSHQQPVRIAATNRCRIPPPAPPLPAANG